MTFVGVVDDVVVVLRIFYNFDDTIFGKIFTIAGYLSDLKISHNRYQHIFLISLIPMYTSSSLLLSSLSGNRAKIASTLFSFAHRTNGKSNLFLYRVLYSPIRCRLLSLRVWSNPADFCSFSHSRPSLFALASRPAKSGSPRSVPSLTVQEIAKTIELEL